jgi:CDP-diacylglycerol--glycerol-3-phosphate 3-phosphatidyltransferase
MTSSRSYGESALLTPANLLTGFRLVVAPLFIYLICTRPISWWTTIVGGVAAASDYFDGIVARRQGTTTSGAFLDPLADKIIVLGSLYALVYKHHDHFWTSFWIPAVIITLREMWMSVHRSRASKRGISIPASHWAKWKTMVQDLAIALSVIPWVGTHPNIALVTIWIAVVLTVLTGWQYYVEGRKALGRAG